MNELIITTAQKLAQEAFQKDEVPVAAIIFNTQTLEIIAAAHNQTEALQSPVAHAEMIAIQQACEKLKSKRLNGYSIFVTLEPCPMCASAISWAHLDTLYFGAYDPKTGGIEQGPCIFTHTQTHHKMTIQGGIEADKFGKLMTDFFKSKRKS